MTKTIRGWTIGLATLLACGTAFAQRRPAPTQPPAEQQAVQQGMEALFKAMQGAAEQSAAAELIPHREMRALLPAELKGFRRSSASSERQGAMGMTISRAEAQYQGAQNARIKIEISDLGGLGGFGMMAHAAWASADLDKESDDGFERTVEYKKNKAMEEYNTRNKSGKIQVLVGGRLMLSIEGSGVPFETIRGALDLLDLDKLAALKPAPAN